MPELPEVETIRRGLIDRICGKVIVRVEVRLDKIILQPTARKMRTALAGQKIMDLRRRGKYLLFDTTDYRLLVHLGMTGQLTYWDKKQRDDLKFHINPLTGLQRAHQHSVDKHTHISIYLADGNALHYRDIRQFGKWRLYAVQEFEASGFLDRLGLEPFTREYSLPNFLHRLAGRTLRMKSLLLNQSFVAGVGNIYADEALFEASIHPEQTANSLSEAEKKRLFKAIPKVLQRGLDNGGTTLQDFVNAEGNAGGNQDFLKVYGREKKQCKRCRAAIHRIVVSQRSSHFCPACQPFH